jgi:hypothetical protein
LYDAYNHENEVAISVKARVFDDLPTQVLILGQNAIKKKSDMCELRTLLQWGIMRAYKMTSVFSNYFGGESLASIAVKRLYPARGSK